jgi:hypothetical protein
MMPFDARSEILMRTDPAKVVCCAYREDLA